MCTLDQLCHAIYGTTSAAPRNTFYRRDTVSEDKSRNRHHAKDPEEGRDIPRGTDEESDAEGSGGDTGKSAKPSTSDGQHKQDMRQSRTDREHGR
jgi:hypothetical protein